MNRRRKTTSTWLPVVVLIAAGALIVNVALGIGRSAPEDISVAVEGYYDFDPSDPTQLVADGTDIFVGTVSGVRGAVELPTSDPESVLPLTLYDVEVGVSVLGVSEGTIVVKQSGGCIADLCTYDENDGPWAPGDEFLFATRYSPANGWYGVYAPGYGNIQIESDEQREELIATFAAATGSEPTTPTSTAETTTPVTATAEPTETSVPIEAPTLGPTPAPTEEPATQEPTVVPTPTQTVPPAPTEAPMEEASPVS